MVKWINVDNGWASGDAGAKCERGAPAVGAALAVGGAELADGFACASCLVGFAGVVAAVALLVILMFIFIPLFCIRLMHLCVSALLCGELFD